MFGRMSHKKLTTKWRFYIFSYKIYIIDKIQDPLFHDAAGQTKAIWIVGNWNISKHISTKVNVWIQIDKERGKERKKKNEHNLIINELH